MTNNENERVAYAAGDMVTADLYHRLDQLTQALGEALAELEQLKEKHTDALAELEGANDELAQANDYAADLRRELDRTEL
jgi:chromosome segregation ATPase